MKTKKIILLAITLALLLGCSQQERDCKEPRNKQEQQECAHEASTSSNAIPDTLSNNHKRW